jgi:predicted DNA-binding transcriptional regulator AlpA
MTKANEELLTTREVADLLRLNHRTLEKWRWLKVGPPYVRVGGRVVRYRYVEVLRWMRAAGHWPSQWLTVSKDEAVTPMTYRELQS